MTSLDFRLNVLQLQFALKAETMVHLGAQAGAQIRGALWSALRTFACTDPYADPAQQAEHSQHCPMCRLVALETANDARGTNPARPFAVRPPLSVHPEQDRLYDRGELFTVGISLFGDARDLAGYVCQAMYRAGEIGIGYGRGRFSLHQIRAVNEVTGEQQDLLRGPAVLVKPETLLSEADVRTKTTSLAPDRVRLRFLTPMMLKQGGAFCGEPEFLPLIARLIERCQSLDTYYGGLPASQEHWRETYLELSAKADGIKSTPNTRWVRLESGSRRTGERNSMGGFVGEASFSGHLEPFLEWLVWGETLHVGKNVVKGNGWYQIIS